MQLRGVRPFFSDKFDITKHPRYQYLSDADKRNVFDVERYMKRRPAIVKPDEPFDMYELNASDLEPDNNNSTKRKEVPSTFMRKFICRLRLNEVSRQ